MTKGQIVVGRGLVLGLLTLSCSPGDIDPVQMGAGADNQPVIQGPGYVGVIFPTAMSVEAVDALGVDATDYWVPATEDVARLESGLRASLVSASDDPALIDQRSTSPELRDHTRRAISNVLDHLPQFRRQYVGIIAADGSRRILVNSFPEAKAGEWDMFASWRRAVVVVDDGGYSFWRIQYDVSTGRYFDFDTNGG